MADHWKCTACHHEWDGGQEKCDWCGEPGVVIGTYHWPTQEEFRAAIDEAMEVCNGKGETLYWLAPDGTRRQP